MGLEDKEKDIKIYRDGDFDKKVSQKAERRRWKNDNLLSSLEFALSGILTAVKEERNMRKHLLTSLGVIILGFVFQVSATDWLFLLMCIALVIAGELINSAIENVVDLAADYNFHMRAKRAKDMAAGAVVILSLFSILVGAIIFLPKIWHLIFK